MTTNYKIWHVWNDYAISSMEAHVDFKRSSKMLQLFSNDKHSNFQTLIFWNPRPTTRTVTHRIMRLCPNAKEKNFSSWEHLKLRLAFCTALHFHPSTYWLRSPCLTLSFRASQPLPLIIGASPWLMLYHRRPHRTRPIMASLSTSYESATWRHTLISCVRIFRQGKQWQAIAYYPSTVSSAKWYCSTALVLKLHPSQSVLPFTPYAQNDGALPF